MVSFTLVPLAAAGSAPVAGHLFEPLLAAAPALARAWGAGPGAALGLMLSGVGVLLFAGSLVVAARGGLALAPRTAERLA